jgi:hypothetical protein
MKIRNGFVSNSSSSSFVLILKEEDHLRALNSFEDSSKKTFLENVMLNKEKKFGIDFRSYFGRVENGRSSLSYVNIFPEEDWNHNLFNSLKQTKVMYWENYISKLDELNIEYFYISNYE